jgi:Na+/proline symporter
MKDFLLWKNAKSIFYMASIAATWIWTPAIFTSSEKAYFSGVNGFLMFLIPNVLTLVIFAFFAEMVRKKTDGFTLSDVIRSAGSRQRNLHLSISMVILICSTCVQLLGLHTLFSAWGNIPKGASALIVCVAAFLMVGKSGIKGSIKTDFVKYVIMLAGGLILLFVTIFNADGVRLEGVEPVGFWQLMGTFGVSTMIGLLSAPYVDQTFWQRAFSIEKGDIRKTFIGSALLFAIIPTIFGLIGFFSSGDTSWNIATAFNGTIPNAILAVCVLCALISTLDSNLCAISSIVCADMKQSIAIGRLSMILLLALGSAVMVFTNIGITDMFLIYGTIRTCAALPTILIILGRYNANRLFWATLTAVLVAPAGYIVSTDYKWLFTLLALVIPAIGIANKRRSNCEIC